MSVLMYNINRSTVSMEALTWHDSQKLTPAAGRAKLCDFQRRGIWVILFFWTRPRTTFVSSWTHPVSWVTCNPVPCSGASFPGVKERIPCWAPGTDPALGEAGGEDPARALPEIVILRPQIHVRRKKASSRGQRTPQRSVPSCSFRVSRKWKLLPF